MPGSDKHGKKKHSTLYYDGLICSPLYIVPQEMKRVKSAGTARQMHHSKSWWSYLFSHQETEGENNHHENHTHRTE